MKTLQVDFNYVSIVAKVVKEATHRQKIEVPSTSMRLFRNLGCWHKMDGPTVTHICGDNFTDIRSILVAPTHLTSLQFCGNVLKSSGTDEEESLVMTSSKCLSIKHMEPFWPITCPNLTHLILGPFSGPNSPPDQSISLPRLTELVFFASYTSAGILRGLEVPSLHKLVLQRSGGKAFSARGFKELWPLQLGRSSAKNKSPSGVEPKVLHLHNFPINPNLLVRTLNERPLVEEFRVDGVMLNSGFFEGLAPARTAKAKGAKGERRGMTGGEASSRVGWIGGCPDLSRLIIDLSHTRSEEQQIEATAASAKAFVAQRLKNGTPLEQLSINFGAWEGFHEFVEV
jgi:hypothetical protein